MCVMCVNVFKVLVHLIAACNLSVIGIFILKVVCYSDYFLSVILIIFWNLFRCSMYLFG